MPPLPPVPNVFKVAISGTDSGGNKWANVLHYHWSGSTPSSATLAAIALNVQEFWQAQVTPVQSVGTTLTTVTVTDLTSSAGAVGESSATIPGTRTGAILPGSTAVLISYPGAGPRYRGGHPRTYLLAGTNADLLDESHWTAAATAEFQAAWLDFTTSLPGVTVSGCVVGEQCAVSYYTTDYSTTPHTRIRKAIPDVYNISAIVAQEQLASQRGRIGRKRR